ncbi:MAG: D-alanyl-D-alanine carboxypeptidase [Clostridia bacterium]|nr:D-alanyl-D-alanine carboxypeptidase [Clostridia bacterium]
MFVLCSGVVFADEVETTKPNEKITTEYYSDDLNEPLYFDATETVASIGAVLEIPAKSCVLIEVSTGKVLYENESHMKLAPASITKVMALLLTMEAIESGQLTVETKLRASEHACSMGGSQIWLEPGEEMSVDDLLKATVIGSANDATVVLGEAIAGSEESFVAMMNERAAQLGLEDTTFINCTGLDADGHLTSAYDIAIMSKELIKHDLIKNYSTVWMDSLRNGESELVNTNKLVRFYEGCTGLKTGTTSGAGACLTASAERNNMELVAVVMGAANSTDRFNGARKLLDYGFANWSAMGVTADASTLTEIPVKNGVERTVSPVCNETKSVLIEKAKAGELNLITELSPELKAPIQVGQQVGMTRIMLGDEEIGTVPIVAGETVAKKTFLSSFLKVLKSCFSV